MYISDDVIFIDVKNVDIDDIFYVLNKTISKNIFISNIEEFFFSHEKHLDNFNNILIKNNCKLYIFISCKRRDYLNFSNIEFLFFPYYLHRKTYFNSKDIFLEKEKVKTDKFDNLFLCLNHHPRPHRIKTLDCLKKYDLFDSGNYTLCYYDNNQDTDYWKVQVNRLDDENEFNVGSSGHWNLVNYGNPLISLITETLYNSTYVDNMFFLTEKTSKSILIGQIFLVIGTKNFHKNLKDIGFKLYDEIFDYSFDSMDDDYRIEYAIKQIHNLKNSNYKEIYNIVKNKVEYNKELGFELLKNNNILFDSYTNNFVNQNINTFNKIINDGFLEKYII